MGLSVVFMIANLFQLTSTFFIPKDDQLKKLNLYLKLLFYILAESLLQAAHWRFTIEYIDCALSMPFVIRKQEMPPDKRKRLTMVYYSVIAIQFLLTIAYGIVLFYYIQADKDD